MRDRSVASKLSLVFLATLLFVTSAFAADIPKDLRKAVEDYDHAQVNANGAELRRLVADDYVLVNSSGQVQKKAALIAEYLSRDYKIEPFTVLLPASKAVRAGG